MTLSLPDDAACWDAPSAHSWKALRSQGSADDGPASFRMALRSTFATRLSEGRRFNDGQHLHIIVSTLACFVWSIKDVHASLLHDVVPEDWPSLHTTNLLNKLDGHLAPLNIVKASASEQELRQAVARALTIHICHLYGAGDLMDWLPGVLRAASMGQTVKERMQTWGKEDPVRLRRVTYHSAQIIAICRDFPFNAPHEPFFVFHAGTALWCAAQLLPAYQTNTGSGSPPSLLFLDRQIAEGDADYFEVLKWIREGGNVVIGLRGVPILGAPFSDIQMMEETARLLCTMRVWGISSAFISLLRRLV